MDNSENGPAPRLCHINRWPDFEGYGFNLHADKNRNGQFIGKVDEGSPAEAAGLKTGDRIVEVNGVNISNENHKQVVERIKTIPNETRLLVVDSEADNWYKTNKVVILGTQKNVIFLQNPATRNGGKLHSAEELINPPREEPPSSSRSSQRSSPIQSTKSTKSESPKPTPIKQETVVTVEPVAREYTTFEEDRKNFYKDFPTTSSEQSTPPTTHKEKRPSITFTEHAPVAIIQPEKHEIDNKHKEVDEVPQLLQHHDRHHHHHTEDDAPGLLRNLADFETKVETQQPAKEEPEEMKKKELYQETKTVTRDGEEADRLASQLLGFTVIGEDIDVRSADSRQEQLHSVLVDHDHKDRRSSHSEHVHFAGETSRHDVSESGENIQWPKPHGHDSEIANGKEVIEERVVHSPAFLPPTPVPNKEQLIEKVHVHRAGSDAPRIESTEPTSRDTFSEDSGSRSFSSAENHSDKENGLRRHGDDSSYDGSKTPSPSPAVTIADSSRFPAATTSVNNGIKSSDEKMSKAAQKSTPKPVDKSTPKPVDNRSSFGDLALNLSVQEMRATIQRNRKKDPRTQPMDLRKKYDMINNM